MMESSIIYITVRVSAPRQQSAGVKPFLKSSSNLPKEEAIAHFIEFRSTYLNSKQLCLLSVSCNPGGDFLVLSDCLGGRLKVSIAI